MPKNPNRRRINRGKVTHVTLVTKDTARGSTDELVRSGAQHSQVPTTGTPQSSPIKTAGSASPILPDPIADTFLEDDMEFQEEGPGRVIQTKMSI